MILSTFLIAMQVGVEADAEQAALRHAACPSMLLDSSAGFLNCTVRTYRDGRTDS